MTDGLVDAAGRGGAERTTQVQLVDEAGAVLLELRPAEARPEAEEEAMTRQSPEGAFGARDTVPRSQPVEPEDNWEEGADAAADRYERDMLQ